MIGFDVDVPVGRWADYEQAVDDGDVPILVADLPPSTLAKAVRSALDRGRTYIVIPQDWQPNLERLTTALRAIAELVGDEFDPCGLATLTGITSTTCWEVCLLDAGHDGPCGPDDAGGYVPRPLSERSEPGAAYWQRLRFWTPTETTFEHKEN